jgi:transposase
MIPPIYVKPFVKRQKNDAADAAAIAEAAMRPNMHCVAVKSAEHQARAVAFRTHQCLVGQRTQLINALRGHLAEFGLVVAKGPANLKTLASMMDDATVDLPETVRDIVQLYLDQIELITRKIDDLTLRLRAARERGNAASVHRSGRRSRDRRRSPRLCARSARLFKRQEFCRLARPCAATVLFGVQNFGRRLTAHSPCRKSPLPTEEFS